MEITVPRPSEEASAEELIVEALSKAVLALNKGKAEVHISLSAGSYLLENPLVLDQNAVPEYEGKLIIQGHKDKSRISGTRALRGLQWEKNKDGFFSTKLPSLKGQSLKGLFVNGHEYRAARFPSFDESILPLQGYATESHILKRSKEKKWSRLNEAYLHCLHGGKWGDYHYRIQGRYFGRFTLQGGHQNNRPEMSRSRKYQFAENIREELDSPGEYYYDREKGMLSLVPLKEDRALDQATIEAVMLENLITIKGFKSSLKIKDLSFSAAAPTFMKPMEALLRSDWMISRSGALFIEDSENINIEGCRFQNLGGNALFISKFARNISIKSCLFKDIGASGIAFVGSPDDVRNPLFNYHERYESIQDRQEGPSGENHPEDCLVFDNIITRTGRIEKQSAGVQISMAESITVLHNSIYEVPRAGINIGDGTWGGHILEGNAVFDTVKETSDHGAFNSWGRDRFWDKSRSRTDKWVMADKELPLKDACRTNIIRQNCFRCDFGWDIDLDDGSSNYEISRNLCLSGGIKLREGYHRSVTGNVMVNNGFHPHVWYKSDDSDVFTANIVMAPHAPVALKGKGALIDRNFFHKIPVSGQAFAHWDKESLSGEAGFLNPSTGDYRVNESSPALSLGFKNFPMDAFGVQSEAMKSLARKPELPELKGYTRNSHEEIREWNGIQIKAVETEGEKSAAGLESCTGIIVKGGVRLEELGLLPEDVILQINSKAVNSLEDILKMSKGKRSIKVLISRNQSLIKQNLKI